MELGSAPVKPKLRLIGAADFAPEISARRRLDAPSRSVLYSRIRDLARMYCLAWLVRQETQHVGGVVECLDDDELCSLRDKMERARECRVEGVGFDEAGLVRAQGE